MDIYDPDYNFKGARMEYRQNPQNFLRMSKEADGSLYLSSDNTTVSQNQKKQKRNPLLKIMPNTYLRKTQIVPPILKKENTEKLPLEEIKTKTTHNSNFKKK